MAARRRVCFTLQVDPARLDEYRERHAAVWPEMLVALHDAGWHDYSLHLRGDGLLVGTLMTEDFPAAQAAMARTEVNARWQAEMGGFFIGLDGPPDQAMRPLNEVFHLEDQLEHVGWSAGRTSGQRQFSPPPRAPRNRPRTAGG